MGTIYSLLGLGTAAIIAVSPSSVYAANQQLPQFPEGVPPVENVHPILQIPKEIVDGIRDMIVTTEEYTNKEVTIPAPVLEEFERVVPGYLEKRIRQCVKRNNIIWKLDRGGGFAGVANYYSGDGSHLGEEHTDTDYHTRKKPPVDLRDYKCTVVKSLVYKIKF